MKPSSLVVLSQAQIDRDELNAAFLLSFGNDELTISIKS